MPGKSLILVAFFTLLLAGCSQMQTQPPSLRTQYNPVTFEQLKGWNQKEAEGLRNSLMQTCSAFKHKRGMVNSNPIFGSYQQWHTLCKQLAITPQNQLTQFFKANFQAYQINPEDKGLFTGYYTPVYPGSRTKSPEYTTPLLKTPNDLIRVKLNQFYDGSGTLYGKVNKGWLVPYDNRTAINKRFRQGNYKKDVLCWMKNPVDRIFLQIQGSGYIQLPSGEKVLMQFASKNGQPYYPIGRYLKQNNLLKNISMQTIRQWLKENPSQAQKVLNLNKSFVFFSESSHPPLGALGVPVTADRSVAIDPRYIPLGYPVWIDTTLTATGQSYQHAFAAQDTGSAIKGAVRADIYFGVDNRAALYAGHQNASGKLFILAPK